MKTVKEISQLTGVSIRTLHHYDSIGLLKPTQTSEAGYRLYDDAALERLYLIIVYRELGFSLKKIGELLNARDFDRNRALDEQIALLELKKEQIQNRITFAHGLKLTGVRHLNYDAFDYRKFDEYSTQAKAMWGNTGAYGEFVQKAKGRTKEDTQALADEMMALFVKAGSLRHLAPGSEKVQGWVAELQNFITAHYYTCTKPMLKVLGEMYDGGGSMTENIDNAGGKGTGTFAKQAIDIFCGE